jgi:hypothetical protein
VVQQQQLQQGGVGARDLVVANPLAAAERRVEGTPAPVPVPAPAASGKGGWERCSDEQGDVWYVHSVTGESVWELPGAPSGAAGAV